MIKNMKCCQVESIVSVDGRGQIVLPKEVREKIGVKAGDKFVIASSQSEGKVCCLWLIKAEEFAGTLREALGPIAKDILK